MPPPPLLPSQLNSVMQSSRDSEPLWLNTSLN